MADVIDVVVGPPPVVEVVVEPPVFLEVTAGLRGYTGLSAFEVAQAEGFEGTEAEWLESLVGQDGLPGADSTVPGPPGLNGTGLLMGSGFPEGVVSAPVGTFYSDSANTAGASLWRKASGSGATGWVIARGNTGWRAIGALTINGWTAAASAVRINRSDDNVTIEIADLYATTATAQFWLVPPHGFRPHWTARRMLYTITPAFSVVRSDIHPELLSVEGYTTGFRVRGVLEFITNDPWPSTLPGTPA